MGAGFLILLIAAAAVVAGASKPVTTLIPVILFQTLWCFVEGWTVQTYRPLSGHREMQDRPGMLPLASGLVALVMAILAVGEALVSGPPKPAVIGIGFVMGTLGIAMRQIAIAQLGFCFRDAIDLSKNHEQVTSGLFRVVRHPAETGFLLGMGGLVIISGSLPAAAVFGVCLLPLSLARIVLENRLLRERFGT